MLQQADSIANHLSTTSATATSYESYVEMIHTFCQTIDHANCKSVHEKNRRKALQTEYQQSDVDMDVDVDAMRKRMVGLVDAIRDVAGRVVVVVVEAGTTIGSLRSNLIVSTKLDINNSYMIVSHEVKSKLTLSKPLPYLL